MKKLLLILLCTCLRSIGGSNEPAALIIRMSGNVALCEAPCNLKPDQWPLMVPAQNQARILHANDEIGCRGGILFIYSETRIENVKYQPGETNTDVCKGRRSSFKIPEPVLEAKSYSHHVLFDYENSSSKYRRAGREKSLESKLYVPAEKSVIIPGKLIVRWRTQPSPGPFTLVLTTDQNAELIHLDNIDGARGSLDSESLRKILESIRDDPARNHDLKLIIRADMQADDFIHFSVLSRAEESSLDESLSRVDKSPGLLGCIQRAGLYESAHMYDKVAAEYDEALNDAPESRNLLEAAYNANTRIGNLDRAKKLREQIDKSEPASKSQ